MFDKVDIECEYKTNEKYKIFELSTAGLMQIFLRVYLFSAWAIYWGKPTTLF